MNIKDQGAGADIIFHGEATSEAVRTAYKESATLFSSLIREYLPPGSYEMVDFGSHKGGFLKDVIDLLPLYKFHTIAVDVNGDDLKANVADRKIHSDLLPLPIEDKSVDITLARYVIAWNTLEQQKEILKEISRITKKIAIIQHQGADENYPKKLQNAAEILFSGVAPQLNRMNFFFSTSKQVEEIMNNLGINFERIQNRKIEDLSDIFIEKYKLQKDEADKVYKILKDTNSVMQSAWILKLKQ